MPINLTRRRFLHSAALAGAAGLLPPLGPRAAEPGPETVTIKPPRDPAICTMPQMITEQLLQAEGFTSLSMSRPATPASCWRAARWI